MKCDKTVKIVNFLCDMCFKSKSIVITNDPQNFDKLHSCIRQINGGINLSFEDECYDVMYQDIVSIHFDIFNGTVSAIITLMSGVCYMINIQ